MNTAEFLKSAKALIDTPEKWTQRAYARDGGGASTDERDPEAICFCTSGALNRVAIDAPTEWQVRDGARVAIWAALEQLCYPDGIIDFNDAPGRTHAEVVEMLDIAIEKAGAK